MVPRYDRLAQTTEQLIASIEGGAVMDELKALAETLADWVELAPDIPAIYLFGSRVRGDHGPDSDVDVRLYICEWKDCEATRRWWEAQNKSDFIEVKARLRATRS